MSSYSVFRLKEILAQQERDIAIYQQQLLDKDYELRMALEKLAAAEIMPDIRNQLQTERVLRQNAERVVEDLDAQLVTTRQQRDEMFSQLEEMRQLLESLTERAEKAEKERQIHEAVMQERESRIVELERETDNLRSQLESLQINGVQKEALVQLQQRNEQLMQILRNKDAELEKLREQLSHSGDDLRQRLLESQRLGEERETEIFSLRENMQQLETELAESKARAKEMWSKWREQEEAAQEWERLYGEAGEKLQAAAALNSEIAQLKEMLEAVNRVKATLEEELENLRENFAEEKVALMNRVSTLDEARRSAEERLRNESARIEEEVSQRRKTEQRVVALEGELAHHHRKMMEQVNFSAKLVPPLIKREQQLQELVSGLFQSLKDVGKAMSATLPLAKQLLSQEDELVNLMAGALRGSNMVKYSLKNGSPSGRFLRLASDGTALEYGRASGSGGGSTTSNKGDDGAGYSFGARRKRVPFSSISKVEQGIPQTSSSSSSQRPDNKRNNNKKAKGDREKLHCFYFVTDERTYEFGIESKEVMLRWVELIFRFSPPLRLQMVKARSANYVKSRQNLAGWSVPQRWERLFILYKTQITLFNQQQEQQQQHQEKLQHSQKHSDSRQQQQQQQRHQQHYHPAGENDDDDDDEDAGGGILGGGDGLHHSSQLPPRATIKPSSSTPTPNYNNNKTGNPSSNRYLGEEEESDSDGRQVSHKVFYNQQHLEEGHSPDRTPTVQRGGGGGGLRR